MCIYICVCVDRFRNGSSVDGNQVQSRLDDCVTRVGCKRGDGGGNLAYSPL